MVAAASKAGMTTATSARPGIGSGAPLENREHRLQLGTQVLDRLSRECAPRLGFELPRAAVLLDLLARPLDRVFLRVQEMLHEHDQLDFAPLVHTVPGAVLGGVQEPELTLPVPQNVGLQIGELADLADREELLNRMRRAHRPPAPPPPPGPHCSGLSSRSMRSATAWRGGLPWNNTAATSRAIGNSTPCCSPSATAERAAVTPSAT